MEDKKVMKFINDNHEKAFNDYKDQLKKAKRKEKVLSVLYVIALIVAIIFFIGVVQNDTKKAIEEHKKTENNQWKISKELKINKQEVAK